MTKVGVENLCDALARLESSRMNRAACLDQLSRMTDEDWVDLGRQVEALLTQLKAVTKLEGICWLEILRVRVHRDIGAAMRGQVEVITSSS